MNERLERILGITFGLIFLGLSVVVSVETIMRKLFNMSMQGADELGGYALALGATLAFTVALIGRAHVRVDVFLVRFPKRLQTWLNWLSSVLLMGFAVLMAVLACFTLLDSNSYQSVSQTPWATPLVYPQALWMIALGIFAVLALVQALLATVWLLRRQYSRIDAMLAPKSTQDEVEEELQDLQARSNIAAPAPATALTTTSVSTPSPVAPVRSMQGEFQ